MPKKKVAPKKIDYMGSLADYKASTKESPSPSGSTRSEKKSKHFLAAQKFLEETKGVGFVNELKSLLDPKNLTGANAIESALNVNGKGAGLSPQQRVIAGLTGVVQGVTFAAGSAKGGVAVQGIKNTGLPARIVNKVKSDIVVVHGTGRPIVGKTINPTAGSAYSPTEPAAFAWNTQHGAGKTGGQNWMHQALQEYTNKPYINAKGVSVPGERNIVIGKTKMKDAFPELSSKSIIASKQPIKITKVIKEEPMGAKIYEQQKNFIQELKRAGVKVEPNAAQRAFSKIEAAKLAKRNRLRNENSPT